MKLVVQRVKETTLSVDGKLISEIKKGLAIYVGIAVGDSEKDVDYFAEKVVKLRVFEDENGKMNLSVKDVGGKILAVSQFTLAGDCSRGNRPGFDGAAEPTIAKELYEHFMERVAEEVPVESGIFQADMQVHLVNDGPVTFMLEKKCEKN